jgi:hypothetical protein
MQTIQDLMAAEAKLLAWVGSRYKDSYVTDLQIISDKAEVTVFACLVDEIGDIEAQGTLMKSFADYEELERAVRENDPEDIGWEEA